MALLTGLLMGTAAGVTILTASLIAFRRRKGASYISYKSPVTELLQVTLIDTRIKMTDLDTLEMNSTLPNKLPANSIFAASHWMTPFAIMQSEVNASFILHYPASSPPLPRTQLTPTANMKSVCGGVGIVFSYSWLVKFWKSKGLFLYQFQAYVFFVVKSFVFMLQLYVYLYGRYSLSL